MRNFPMHGLVTTALILAPAVTAHAAEKFSAFALSCRGPALDQARMEQEIWPVQTWRHTTPVVASYRISDLAV